MPQSFAYRLQVSIRRTRNVAERSSSTSSKTEAETYGVPKMPPYCCSLDLRRINRPQLLLMHIRPKANATVDHMSSTPADATSSYIATQVFARKLSPTASTATATTHPRYRRTSVELVLTAPGPKAHTREAMVLPLPSAPTDAGTISVHRHAIANGSYGYSAALRCAHQRHWF